MAATEKDRGFPLDVAVDGVRSLRPYLPGKPVDELERELGLTNIVKLASNENPEGPGVAAREAAGLALGELTRYPDGNGFGLKKALAAFHGLDEDCITLGNGSNDVLDLVARTFLSPEAEAVFSEHAFAVYPISTRAAGASAAVAPAHDGSRGPRFGHDLDAMRAAINERTRVVFIANPNNPTGTWCDAGSLRAFVSSVPGNVVVVIDEAYIEYVEADGYPDASQWLQDFPNLVVTRTFSKVYGLAALRVGYALSHPEVADLLNRVRQPFNVNSVALAAAEAALGDQDYVRASVERNREGMAQLVTGLSSLGLTVLPSVGNFLLADFGRPAIPVYDALLREGVIVRPVDNYGLPDQLRITIGTVSGNARLLDALARVMQA